jgi:hypothetical protein
VACYVDPAVLQLRGLPPMTLDTWLQWWHPTHLTPAHNIA